MPQIKQIFIHPIKGLTPQPCTKVNLEIGHGIPGDRAFALKYQENETITNLTTLSWQPKQNFIMQNDWAGLAALTCNYDAQTNNLTIKRKEIELLTAHTNTASGREMISSFFTGYLAAIYPSQTARHPQRAPLQLVGDGKTTRYPDREPVHISLLSQATLDELTTLAGQSIDVRRFRPNIVIQGIPAWSEFDWVGQEMQLGTAKIAITARINRCLNIEVNPETGERDIALLKLLKQHFQHTQTGVLAQIISSGTVEIDDDVII